LAELKNAILDMTELDEIRLLRFDELFQRLQARTMALRGRRNSAESTASEGHLTVGTPQTRLKPQLVRDAVSLLSNPICGNANQIFRPVTLADYGIDGEIEFRDNEGKASGRKIYVQLKCGGSRLRHRQRDETEVFDADERHLEYWTSQVVDVYLVIRDAERKIRWMNVTRYLNDRADKASRQIVFSGDEVTTEQLWRVRDIYAG